MEHVGVGDHNVSRAADRRADLRRRVAVVRVGLEIDVDVARKALELRELVLRERLRREEVESARRRILRDRVDDRQVVAERLAGRRRRDDDDVLARARRFECRGLM